MAGFGKMFTRPDEQVPAIPSAELFSRVVMLVADRYRISHMDAILELCERTVRDYESVRPLLTPKLRLLLVDEAAQRNLLKDRNYLARKLG